jgi:hypothetical protein
MFGNNAASPSQDEFAESNDSLMAKSLPQAGCGGQLQECGKQE